MRTEAKRWVYICVWFSEARCRNRFGQISEARGVLREARNGYFGFSFEQFLGLGRPWAVWRPQTTCFYLLLAPERPKLCIFTCFLVPGDPKSRVFTCLWPPGARNHLFNLFLDPQGPKPVLLAPRGFKPVFENLWFFA